MSAKPLTQATAFFLLSISATLFGEARSRFECLEQAKNRYRPYYIKVNPDGTSVDYSTKSKGLLGQNAMPTLTECEDALDAANHHHGVICSRTGLNGWKPTLYTGTRPGRADYGYLGGSSITRLSDCLEATRKSSRAGVCYWGGSNWYISAIDREKLISGPYRSLNACVAVTAP